MEYLSITLKNMDKKMIKQFKQLFSSFESEFSRIYKSQIKFEGEESKKWAYFFICELSDNSKIDALKSITSMTSDLREYVIRTELMELTPGSFLKKVLHKTGMTIIEHVNVQEEYLIDFQNIMINNNTPAMKYIIEEKGWCNEFIALETKNILYHDSTFKSWNQIHLVDMAAYGIFRYKKDFNDGLRLVDAPSFKTNFKKLSNIRTFTYKFKSKLI
ncbi:hypothetical protein [Enterococcus sp. RIT-PI-f]|uniref:hypothetical protein n=1 Tax=Enterococcus sp. RIT-PI-f TaxID=1690244 RepID=UPI0006B97617|nr:hypothetical protein [Enterococcus sp. RIT-PI-f]